MSILDVSLPVAFHGKKLELVKVYEYGWIVLLIAIGIGIRLFLAGQGWPSTNSDEGTIGIMARHIAYQGDRPTFYYGQNYMGATEAYVGAGLFRIFGPSLFTLRTGLVLIFALFLVSMYFLTRLLYNRGLALFVLVTLSAGSGFVMSRELSAIGGYPETLLTGSLAFTLAALLVLTRNARASISTYLWRLLGYGCWGLVSGVGLWSDLLVLPFILCSGLYLMLFCWREWISILPVLSVLAGLVIGAFPLLSYNLHAKKGEDSLTILMGLHHDGLSQSAGAGISVQLWKTFSISLPLATGNPFCPVTELPFLGPTSPASRVCTLAHVSWSLIYCCLFICALIMALWALGRCVKRVHEREQAEWLQQVRLQCGRLLLLGSGLLALYLYTFSGGPVIWPGIHARYIIGLLIVTPAVLWPLWALATRSTLGAKGSMGPGNWSGIVLLGVVGIMMGLGVILTFTNEVPVAQQEKAQQQSLISGLLALHITHIYTNYWTCNKIAFISNERITCGIVDGNLNPSHNRVPGYYTAVHADPHSAYVFYPIEYQSSIAASLKKQKRTYRQLPLAGYIVYQPET